MTGTMRSLYHAVAYNFVQRFRLNRTTSTDVNGFRLIIEPSVMHPRVFKSGRYFAEFLEQKQVPPGTEVLDLGTGSGILALTAARAGARVTATDNNPNAVSCARKNVDRNGLTRLVEVLEGDLFDPTPHRKFDLILFNPPYLNDPVPGPYGGALFAGENLSVLRNFARQASSYLREGGSILLILSTDAPLRDVYRLFDDRGYTREILWRRKGLFEEFLVCRFTPNAGAS